MDRRRRRRGSMHAHYNDGTDTWTTCDPNTPGHTHEQCLQGTNEVVQTGPPIGPLEKHTHEVLTDPLTRTARPSPCPDDEECADDSDD